MLILAAEADESVVAAAVDRVAKAVSVSGGEVTKVDRWGRRRFAYEIEDQTEGFYVVVQFSAEPSTQVELERVLSLADEVIRFKVTVRPVKKAARRDKGGKIERAAETPKPEKASKVEAVAAVAAVEPGEEPETPEAEEEREASPAPA